VSAAANILEPQTKDKHQLFTAADLYHHKIVILSEAKDLLSPANQHRKE
jgi:hypothetical protein